MKTEMTLEILGDQDDARDILTALAKSGIVVHQARIQGLPVDVTPLVELAAEAAPDDALDALLEDEPEEEEPDEEEALAAIDMTERAGEVALEHVRAGRLAVTDFEGRTPSGATGFTVADVEEIVAENEPAEPEEEPAEPVGV